jgi:levanase/fructan beta-fructosidase
MSSFLSCKNFSDLNKETNMKEKNNDELMYRPNIHFTPQKNWMNDPNGMFYHKGKYHLYFQHNPNSNVWGPMHWGHATSENLIHWDEHPIALYPDKLGTIFSGSAVVDLENTSGFGSIENPPIVAIFTNHNSEEEKKGSELFQNQSIAYSLDDGYSWQKYNGNPVIKNPGVKDFRDPKVIWYEKDKKWILTLAASQVTKFYESKDLKKWNLISSFGEGIGNHNGVWECPDLFQLQVKGTSKTKWVHLVSINSWRTKRWQCNTIFHRRFRWQKIYNR